MPLVTGQITEEGAVISVLVGVSKRRQGLLAKFDFPVPIPIGQMAEIDTGSALTAFRPQIFQRLDIGPVSRIPVATPSTKPGEPAYCDQFDVGVWLVSGMTTVYVGDVLAIAVESFQEDGVQALLGRDVLRRCVFTYNGPEENFQIGFQ